MLFIWYNNVDIGKFYLEVDDRFFISFACFLDKNIGILEGSHWSVIF